MSLEGSYDSLRLVSLTALPGWAVASLGAAALASVLLAAIGLRRERRPTRRAALLALRSLSALCLALLVLEPGVRLLTTLRVKSRLLVLVDDSRSMGFAAEPVGAGETRSRAQAISAWLSDHADDLRALGRRYALELYGFDGDAVPEDLSRLSAGGDPKGPRTDILASLEGAVHGGGGGSGRKLAAALILSDGADNGELAHGIGPREEARLRSLRAPISTIVVGSGELRDLAVAQVKVDDFAFVRNTVTAEVTLSSQGMGGETVPVTLTREGRVIGSQTVELKSGAHRYPLTFKLLPDRTGEFVYTVSVPVFPGEASADNNKRAFVLKVIRDRIRVLLVCGRPSWDERFLRGLLRQDPNVDLVSFFILRGVHDNPKATEDELSLIPFPTEEIFRTDLHTFDVVILQNFAYKPFSSGLSGLHIDSYFPDIKRYVEDGGALLIIGGENSFGEGDYDETELGTVLPVTSVGLPPSTDLFAPSLTEEGKRHPVTALAEGGEASARLWAALPQIPGLNLVRAKPGASVLLAHPLLSTGGAPAPVLVVMDVGRGRSMALTTDSSWYWSLPAEGRGLSNRHYERFWTNAIRWLVRDPQLTQLSLEPERRTVEPGEPIALAVKAQEADYGPARDARITVRLIEAETGKETASAQSIAGPDGAAHFELPSPPPGAYRVIATATSRGTSLGQAQDAVAVRQSGRELEDPLPHPELLRQIADLTGGSFTDGLPRRIPKLHEREADIVEIGRQKDRPIWDSGWPLLALCLTLGSEWWLRRRWGHL
ncbi:MAG: glutamine amidotransferase [Deltaproteobacteria bacterium]